MEVWPNGLIQSIGTADAKTRGFTFAGGRGHLGRHSDCTNQFALRAVFLCFDYYAALALSNMGMNMYGLASGVAGQQVGDSNQLAPLLTSDRTLLCYGGGDVLQSICRINLTRPWDCAGHGADVAATANAMGIFTANMIGWAVLISVLDFVRDYVFIGLCILTARNLFKRYPTLTYYEYVSDKRMFGHLNS
jgi:hypothetical protein